MFTEKPSLFHLHLFHLSSFSDAGLDQPQQGMSGSEPFTVTVGAVEEWRFVILKH